MELSIKDTAKRALVPLLVGMAAAKSYGVEFHPRLEVGYSFGGEKQLEIFDANGGSKALYAAGGVLLAGGLDIVPVDEVIVSSVIGKKSDSLKYVNGSAEQSSWVFKSTAFYNFNNFHFGLGADYHFSNKFECDILNCSGSFYYDDAVGYSGAIRYRINGSASSRMKVEFGARWTKMTMPFKDIDTNANHLTAMVGITF